MSELPPAKSFVVSGDIIQYPKWKSMFELFIESKELKPHQKLIYLKMYLEGKALECINGYNMTSSSVAYRMQDSYWINVLAIHMTSQMPTVIDWRSGLSYQVLTALVYSPKQTSYVSAMLRL